MIFTPPPRLWECPHCTLTDQTPWDTPNRFHPCPGLGGITAPLVLAGDRCLIIVREREDYIGDQDVQRDNDGRPVSAVITEHQDGSTDCLAFPGTAHMKTEY